MIQILFYIYCAGILIGTTVECYNFSQAVKVMDSLSGYFFMVLHTLIETSKHFLWPFTLPLRIVQLFFLKGAAEDMTKVLEEYNGIDSDDWKGW